MAVIARAPVDARTREGWLERLWEAHANDAIPYIERLGDFWGELCVSAETASAWADRLVRIVEMALSPDPGLRGFFHGTTACLSALFRAGRHEEILALLEKDRFPFWPYREWGVRALAALGRPDEAIAYAEASRGINTSSIAIAAACEEVSPNACRSLEPRRPWPATPPAGALRVWWTRRIAHSVARASVRRPSRMTAASGRGGGGEWRR